MNVNQLHKRPAMPAQLSLPMLVMALALLSACGDGSGIDNGGNNDGAIPTATVDEFSKWAATRSPDDGAEPLVVDGLSPPTSDTVEPIVL
jgi:hypothetical protein